MFRSVAPLIVLMPRVWSGCESRQDASMVHKPTSMVRKPNPIFIQANPGETKSILPPFGGYGCVIGLYGIKDGVQRAAIQQFDDRNAERDISMFLRQFPPSNVSIVIYQSRYGNGRRARFTYWALTKQYATNRFTGFHIKYELDTGLNHDKIERRDLNQVSNAEPSDYFYIDTESHLHNVTTAPVFFEIVLGATPDESHYQAISTLYRPCQFHSLAVPHSK